MKQPQKNSFMTMHINILLLHKLSKWAFVLAIMGLIFTMSSQTGDESSVLSGGITSFLVNLFNIKDLETFHFFIRKMAHVTIYALLSFFILNAFVDTVITKTMVMHSFFIALIYAISDEIHQTFIPARSGNVIDVLIDSVGILIGLSLFIKVKPHFTK